MNRFQIYPKFKTTRRWSSFVASPDLVSVWQMTEAEVALIVWLNENVGATMDCDYEIPLRGDGWEIHECYSEDEDMTSYAWRSLHHYEPKGKYGFWLHIDDDDKAVMLTLSNVLPTRDPSFDWGDLNIT